MDTDADTLREAAHAWRVRMADEPSPEDHRAFEAWLEADVTHRRAYARANAVWAAMQTLGAERQRRRHKRPRLWTSVAIAAGIAAVLILLPAVDTQAPQPESLSIQTAQGELHTMDLEDGTSITLGGDSEVRVFLTERERRAVLLRGDVFLEVAPDSNRPFLVNSGAVNVRVVGTAFSVRRDSEGTAVQVSEGRVEVTRADGDGPKSASETLVAGQGIRANLRGNLEEPGVINEHDVAAWRSGRLVFAGAPLREVVATLNRYSEAKIELGDSAHRDAAISAVLGVGDLDSSLAMLTTIFDLEIAREANRIVLRDK